MAKEEAKITRRVARVNLVTKKEQNMSNVNIIRAWKDPAYRRSLTEEQRAALPAHPAGVIEFRVQELQDLFFPSDGGCFSPCRKCYSSGP
jgi:mersacidin/lichenicidin family type 2 lantibiotic